MDGRKVFTQISKAGYFVGGIRFAFGLLDFYDFSDSEERVIFPTVTDGKLYALHRCGLAKAFYTIGTLKFKMTWTRGERLGQNMNDMEKVRSYLLKDDRTNVA